MQLSFLGAAHEVTGSCHYLQACGKHILIDCGMRQGGDEIEPPEPRFTPAQIDYVLLTHAHIDALPLKKGRNQEGKDSLLVIDWKPVP